MQTKKTVAGSEPCSYTPGMDIYIPTTTLVTPEGNIAGDLAISQGRITTAAEIDVDSAYRIDAENCFVLTGLVDLNARVGEPNNPAETILTASRAGVCGGFSTIVAIGDEYPKDQNATRISAADITYLKNRARDSYANIIVAATPTIGDELAPMAELAAAGASFFSVRSEGIDNPVLMRRILQYASSHDVTIATRCEDRTLSAGAVIHEGTYSTRLGLEGNPAASEHIRLCRDLILAHISKAKLHVQTLSSQESVQLIKEHRQRHPEAHVTSEVAAHQLLFDHQDCAHFDPNTVLRPPLRSGQDRQALLEALRDGDIDCIVSAHTPLPNEAKDRPYELCEPGTIGLETALATALSAGLDIAVIARTMSWNPAEIVGLGATEKRNLEPGSVADITVIDPNQYWTPNTAELQSQAKNCITAARQLKGKVRTCIVGGELRTLNGKPL